MSVLPYILANSYQGFAGMPRRYYDYSEFSSFNVVDRLTETVIIAFLVSIAGQLLYLINFGIGLFNRLSKQ
jgi:cytochrome c oxidase subunit 1